MTYFGYFNLKEDERNKFIHRIIGFERFKDILIDNKLIFINPKLWEDQDPYENFLMNQSFETANGTTRSFRETVKNIYGSCWTLNSNSDYSWKVYSKDDYCIELKIKISDFYKSIEYLKNDPNLISLQIGKVAYQTWTKLKKKYEERKNISPFELLTNMIYFEKRHEYRHENEIRILIRYLNHFEELLPIQFDLNDVNCSVLLDPRYDTKTYRRKRTELIDLGFQGKIRRSNLYTPPNMRLIFENITDED